MNGEWNARNKIISGKNVVITWMMMANPDQSGFTANHNVWLFSNFIGICQVNRHRITKKNNDHDFISVNELNVN